MTGKSKTVVYYENWLLKKEGVANWVHYWALIRGKWLQFYELSENNNKAGLRKTLELSTNTQCSLVKRNKRRFAFSINNGMGTYYIKCETELERYHWIFSILSAALGKPKKELPTTIPASMIEKEAFKKQPKENHEPKRRNPWMKSPSPTKSIDSKDSPTKTAADVQNKRRQKFAIRNENRMKRKEAKRAKKLGLNPAQKENEILQQEKPLDELRRTKNIRFSSSDEVNRYLRSEEIEKPTKIQTKSGISTDLTRRENRRPNTDTRPSSAYEPIKQTRLTRHQSNIEIQALVNTRHSVGESNFSYEGDDDIEVLPQVLVKLDDEQLLPNMILTEVSDTESEQSTADTSLTSFGSSSIFPTSGENSSGITSHTYVSSNNDDIFEQQDKKGRIISSPQIRHKQMALQKPDNNHKKPVSPSARLKAHTTLLDRPNSPSYDRPLTPAKKSPARFSRFLVNTSGSIT